MVGYGGAIDGIPMGAVKFFETWRKYEAVARLINADDLVAARRQLAEYEPPNPEHERAAELLEDIL